MLVLDVIYMCMLSCLGVYQVGLLMYPVVCTMILRVFDCRKIEGVDGSWLRADRGIDCQSDMHQNYRVKWKLRHVFFLENCAKSTPRIFPGKLREINTTEVAILPERDSKCLLSEVGHEL